MNFNIQFYFRFLAKLPENVRTVLQTVLLSFAAALGAVLFMALLNTAFRLLYLRASTKPPVTFIGLSFLFTMVSSFIVSLLLKKVPVAAGSGIPQVKAAYWKELGYIPFKNVLIKFIAGIISIGGGASLGREGPTVFLGSGLASFLSGVTGAPKRQRRAATAIGASAGLAAAFNAPLAAITFCIEELINDLNTRYLGRVVIASLIGALTVYALIGKQPAFVLPQVVAGSWLHFLLIPLVAFLSSVLGVLFQRSTIRMRNKMRQPHLLPGWLNPCIGGLITWIIGTVVFLTTRKIGIFGLGYNDLSDSLINGSVWWIAGILVAGKLIATVVSYSFGGCGGIFSPLLFIGGLCGAFISGIAGLWLPTTASDHIILSAVGMSACLGTVIRAPLTSTLIVFEMTHQFEVVPGLMLSAVISQVVPRLAGVGHNFYDALLLQDGHDLIKIKPPRDLQSWQNTSVSNIMNTRPVLIESTDPKYLHSMLSNTPYRCYPYVNNGVVTGIVTRESIEHALSLGKAPAFSEACFTGMNATVKEAADNFINSPHGFLIIMNSDQTLPVGILTLHDLLRAQAAVTE
jgi:CIC family chloride channel protein